MLPEPSLDPSILREQGNRPAESQYKTQDAPRSPATPDRSDLSSHRMHLLPYPALLLSLCGLSLAVLGLDIGIDVETGSSPPIYTSTTITTQTDPTPLRLLPTLLASSPSIRSIDTTPSESIRTTLALYPLAIDGKDFASLSSIFAPDAIANYSAPLNVLTPLQSIQDTLSASLACVSTQHSLGTQVIDVLSPLEARSVTYFTASHFGRSAKMAGQVATAHGQYQDLWRRQEDGSWRVIVRNLVYMSEVIGNQAVFKC